MVMTTTTAAPAITEAHEQSPRMHAACTRPDCRRRHATYRVTLQDRVTIAVRGRDTAGTRALADVLVLVHADSAPQRNRDLVQVQSEAYRAAMGHRDVTAYQGAVAIDALGYLQVFGREVGRVDETTAADYDMALVESLTAPAPAQGGRLIFLGVGRRA